MSLLVFVKRRLWPVSTALIAGETHENHVKPQDIWQPSLNSNLAPPKYNSV